MIRYLWFPLVVGAVAVAQYAVADDVVLVNQNAKLEPRAYVLLQAEMINPDVFFNHYAVPAEVEVARYGGAPVIATFDKQVIEGEWNNNWTLMLNFPDINAAHEWYNSDGYQAVVSNRYAATAYGNMVFFQGVAESQVSWSPDSYLDAVMDMHGPLSLDASPDHVETINIHWLQDSGRATVAASFAPVDAREATVSFEYLLEHEATSDCRLVVVTDAVDTAGKEQRVGRAVLAAGDWTAVSYPLTAQDDHIDLASLNKVLFNVRKKKGAACAESSLKIRRLLIQ